MLHLIEQQISSSYQQPFIPIYRHSVTGNTGFQRWRNGQNKTLQTPYLPQSLVANHRERHSDISQQSIPTQDDLQTRFSLPILS